jgi:hypothetical protein
MFGCTVYKGCTKTNNFFLSSKVEDLAQSKVEDLAQPFSKVEKVEGCV